MWWRLVAIEVTPVSLAGVIEIGPLFYPARRRHPPPPSILTHILAHKHKDGSYKI